MFVAFFEPKDIGHTLSDSNWVNAMHEELENFERNQVWVLVEPPPACNPIGTKWVFKNKQGEDGLVVRNKARLVARGFARKRVLILRRLLPLLLVWKLFESFLHLLLPRVLRFSKWMLNLPS